MQTLEHTFIVLQCLGLWRPEHWLPGWKTKFYDSYTCLIAFLVVTMAIAEFIALMSSTDSIEEFTNNSFILLTLIGDCGKAANILIKRNEIIELTNVLHRDPFRPKADKEYAIQRKFDGFIRLTTLRYGALTGITATAFTLRSFVEDIPRRDLPFKSWLPYDYNESLLGYTFAYIHQTVAFMVGAGISIGFDTLVSGLMLQTCAQLNILKNRFIVMPLTLRDLHREDNASLLAPNSESNIISEHVRHHLKIFKYAKISNDLVGLTILLQYSVSTLVLCVSVYELSKLEILNPKFTSIMLYLACMTAQIFIYCHYGSKVTFESLNLGDAVYAMDWTLLSNNGKRSLLTIMARTLQPIKYTSVRVITLNLDSFNSLIKLSYSAYNVLQQSRN